MSPNNYSTPITRSICTLKFKTFDFLGLWEYISKTTDFSHRNLKVSRKKIGKCVFSARFRFPFSFNGKLLNRSISHFWKDE